MAVDITLYSSWSKKDLEMQMESFYKNIAFEWYEIRKGDPSSTEYCWSWSWIWKQGEDWEAWIHISLVYESLRLFSYACNADSWFFFKPRSNITFSKFWYNFEISNEIIEKLIKSIKDVDKAVIINWDYQYDISTWWSKQKKEIIQASYVYPPKEHIDYIESLILWDSNHPYWSLYYFTKMEFNIENQKKYQKEEFYNEKNFNTLLDIYKKMSTFFLKYPDPWDKDIEFKDRDKETRKLLLSIEILIFDFFMSEQNVKLFSQLHDKHWCAWFSHIDYWISGKERTKLFENWKNIKLRGKTLKKYYSYIDRLLQKFK